VGPSARTYGPNAQGKPLADLDLYKICSEIAASIAGLFLPLPTGTAAHAMPFRGWASHRHVLRARPERGAGAAPCSRELTIIPSSLRWDRRITALPEFNQPGTRMGIVAVPTGAKLSSQHHCQASPFMRDRSALLSACKGLVRKLSFTLMGVTCAEVNRPINTVLTKSSDQYFVEV